jgi:membrane-bound lytic murein transglycosylase D
MPGIGRKFLTVNNFVDERRSPIKASYAAAKLLRENYTILYREWGLALTAWNHGPGGVRRAAKALRTKDIGEIAGRHRTKSFDFASSNFYAEFLGALHAERYSEQTFPEVERLPSISAQEMKLVRATSTPKLLEMMAMTSDEFLLFNPELESVLKRRAALPAGYKILVPEDVEVQGEWKRYIRMTQKLKIAGRKIAKSRG